MPERRALTEQHRNDPPRANQSKGFALSDSGGLFWHYLQILHLQDLKAFVSFGDQLGIRNVFSKRARWAALGQCALHEAEEEKRRYSTRLAPRVVSAGPGGAGAGPGPAGARRRMSIRPLMNVRNAGSRRVSVR
jgi:hypothetical protein